MPPLPSPPPRPSRAPRWNLPHLVLLAALPAWAWWCGRAGLAPSTMVTLGTLLALAWLMATERLWPARPDWAPGPADLLRDGAFLGLNAVTDALGAAALVALSAAVMAWTQQRPGLGAAWSPWFAVPVAVALGELGPYALHRWAHRGGWGWRVHAVHHAPQQVNASNNLTTHPFNVLWNQVARTLPWLLLGLDPQVIGFAALFIQVQSFAVHANVAGTLGPLNHWIGTAELHRWHHSVHPAQALNYSTALPLWDQLFGTYRAPGLVGPAQVGIAGLQPAPRLAWWRARLLAPLCARCRTAG